MFCSDCGKEASSRFCWKCGSELRGSGTSTPDALPKDWSQEIDYAKPIQIPEVKDRLAMQFPKGKKISGEEWLAMYPKPVKLGGQLGYALGLSMGLKVTKARSEVLPKPCGEVLVSVLRHIAGSRLTISRVRQLSEAVILVCEIPSDLWSFKGELLVTVSRTPTGTKVDAALTIPGQMYDMGKGKRIVEKLFNAIKPKPEVGGSKASAVLGSNQAIAKFKFEGDQPGDLAFEKGDIITILKRTEKDSDWWTGKRRDKEGIFPRYVLIQG
jgi:hypothetical protein